MNKSKLYIAIYVAIFVIGLVTGITYGYNSVNGILLTFVAMLGSVMLFTSTLYFVYWLCLITRDLINLGKAINEEKKDLSKIKIKE